MVFVPYSNVTILPFSIFQKLVSDCQKFVSLIFFHLPDCINIPQNARIFHREFPVSRRFQQSAEKQRRTATDENLLRTVRAMRSQPTVRKGKHRWQIIFESVRERRHNHTQRCSACWQKAYARGRFPARLQDRRMRAVFRILIEHILLDKRIRANHLRPYLFYPIQS